MPGNEVIPIQTSMSMSMLAEQKREENIPPIQPDPVVQTLEIENIEKVKLEDNTGLSSVLKRQSKDNLTVKEAQSNNIIETHNQINSVSNNSVIIYR